MRAPTNLLSTCCSVGVVAYRSTTLRPRCAVQSASSSVTRSCPLSLSMVRQPDQSLWPLAPSGRSSKLWEKNKQMRNKQFEYRRSLAFGAWGSLIAIKCPLRMQTLFDYQEDECPWYYFDSSYKTLLGACLILFGKWHSFFVALNTFVAKFTRWRK